MGRCYQCGTWILFGGVKDAGKTFCGRPCHQNAWLEQSLGQYAPEAVAEAVHHVHQGGCFQCHGPGPIDAHAAHQVWSALYLTRWTSESKLSCRKCATKRQVMGILFSSTLGWWGFPWGLVMTPVQITKNVAGLFRKPTAELSPMGTKLIRSMLARQWAAAPQANPPAS